MTLSHCFGFLNVDISLFCDLIPFLAHHIAGEVEMERMYQELLTFWMTEVESLFELLKCGYFSVFVWLYTVSCAFNCLWGRNRRWMQKKWMNLTVSWEEMHQGLLVLSLNEVELLFWLLECGYVSVFFSFLWLNTVSSALYCWWSGHNYQGLGVVEQKKLMNWAVSWEKMHQELLVLSLNEVESCFSLLNVDISLFFSQLFVT